MDNEAIAIDPLVACPARRRSHLLLVDNDVAGRERVANYLRRNDFLVTSADSGKRMLEILQEEIVDLVALELTLQGEDGHSLAHRVRQMSTVPIIIVTSRTEEADRVMGLELGADDYVTKPFSARELVARIRAVMRRYYTSAKPTVEDDSVRAYRFAGWDLNLPLHRLTSPLGERVPISNGQFGLLAAFLGRPDRILSRENLLSLSRLRSAEVYDRSIDVQILRLRRKLETNPSRPVLIKTERGLGYRFCAQVVTLRSTAGLDKAAGMRRRGGDNSSTFRDFDLRCHASAGN